jgi:lipoate-protein ligase A
MNVEKGIIKNVKITGDFLGYEGTQELEQKLIDQRYDYDSIEKVLSNFNLSNIFGATFEKDEVIKSLVK